MNLGLSHIGLRSTVVGAPHSQNLFKHPINGENSTNYKTGSLKPNTLKIIDINGENGKNSENSISYKTGS
ncbi:MAG TPA: hypothetical protein VIM07_06015 [Chitinophagaceae bacterium]